MTGSQDPAPLTGRVRPPHGQQGISAEDVTGLVKVVADSSIRLSAWAAFNGVRAARRAVAALRDPSQAPELIEDFRTVASAVTHAVVGEGDTWIRRVGEQSPVVGAMLDVVDSMGPTAGQRGPVVYPPGTARQADAPLVVEDPVRSHARDLLRRSRDVSERDTAHPAYLTIVRQLAPDELRILLLLLRGGPQPVVDIRQSGLGAASSAPIAKGLSMVGPMAGLRHVQRVPSYLHNLERLGLLENSREVLKDPVEYSVLEAQPDVLGHVHANRRAKVVRRSLRLTAFGEDFLKVGVGLGDEQVGGEPEEELETERAVEEAVQEEPPMSQLVDVEISAHRQSRPRPVAPPVWPSAVLPPAPVAVDEPSLETPPEPEQWPEEGPEHPAEADGVQPVFVNDAAGEAPDAFAPEPADTHQEDDRDAVESRP